MGPVQKGWQTYRKLMVPPNTSPLVVKRIKQAWMASAAMLYTVMMRGVTEGNEVTAEDEAFMQMVDTEIQEIGQDLDREVFGPMIDAVKQSWTSGSPRRKAASAMIAKIPFDLACHVARVYRP